MFRAATGTASPDGSITPGGGVSLSSMLLLDMGRNRIIKVGEPSDRSDAATRDYVDKGFDFLRSEYGKYTLVLDGSSAMKGDLDVGGNMIVNFKDPTRNSDAATKRYVDTQSGIDLLPLDGTRSMTGALNMGSHKGTNVAQPTDNSDAATKGYVTDIITVVRRDYSSRAILLDGRNAMKADLDPDGHAVTNLKDPEASSDAATKQYVDDNLGNVISNAKGNKIEHVGTPTSDDAAATKKYVDDHVCTDAK